MGYRRKKTYKKKYRRRGPRKFSRKSNSKKFKSAVKKVIQSMVEVKYQDTSESNADITTTGTITDITALSRGTSDQGERIGDRVKLRSYRLKGSITGGDATNVIRVIYFIWHPNSVSLAPTMAQILLGGGTPTANSPNLNYVVDGRDQFTVVYDKRFTMVGGSSSTSLMKKFNVVLKLSAIQQYNTTNTSSTKKLYMLRVSDSSAINHPTISYVARTRYIDI